MDAAEFDAFHAGSHPRLLASVRSVTGDADGAEEALERAYVRAWARRRQLGRDVPAETWVRDEALRLSGHEPGVLVDDVPGVDEITAALGELAERPRGPEELRGLGDRRAGRRTGAVVAGVVVGLVAGVVGVVQLLPGGSGGPGPGPDNELQVNPTPLPERPGEVAQDFDLAAGLSQDGRTGPAYDLDAFPGWEVCGRPYELGGLTSPPLAVRSDDFGMESGRVLVVARELDLSDADLNAHGIAERYVQRFERCATGSDAAAGVQTLVERTLVGDEAWTVVRESDDGAREIVQVVRVGSAILVSGTRNVGGDAIALDSFKRAESYAIAPVVQRMCVWNDTGCPS